MGNNYNFKFNPKPPSSEEMNRHKDFGKLLWRFKAEQTQQQRRTRIRRLTVVSAAAAAVALILMLASGIFTIGQQPQMTAEAFFEQQDFITPPLPEVQKNAFTSFRVNADQGGVYEYPSGSRLVVPATAFADDYGNQINGEVDIYYREMHDYVDFFLSGLPLRYDSAGHRFQLESAGAIEIYAEQNGKPVKMAAGKAIDVVLASEIFLSNVEGEIVPPFNVYQIDTFNRDWIYQDLDRIEMTDDKILDEEDPLYTYKKDLFSRLEDIEERARIDMAALDQQYPKPVAPIKPKRANGNQPTLELNFFNGDIEIEDTENGQIESELARLYEKYDGVIWQISPSSPAFDERAFGVEWESVFIRPTNSREYELTLIHPQNQLTLVVSPVLLGNDYEKAMNQYQSELEEYEEALKTREEKLSTQKIALERSVEAQKAAVMDAYHSQLEALRTTGVQFAEGQAYQSKREIINHFSATSFGIWNCARPIQQEGTVVEASLRSQFGKPYRNHIAYVVPKGKNTLYRYYANGAIPMSLSADEDYLIWVVTEDNYIALTKPNTSSFTDKKDHTFTLDVKKDKIEQEKKIRAILQF